MTEPNRSMIPAPAGGVINFGSTQLDATDFIPPRVKILQPMSQETGVNDAKPGDFYNTLTNENYGPTLKVVPITPLKQRVFLFREDRRVLVDTLLANRGLPALSEGDGLKCRSLDMVRGIGEPGDVLWAGDKESGQGQHEGCPECPLAAWQGQKPPPCTETYNVACVSDTGDLVIVGFSKSSAKSGKQWFSMLRLRPGAPWTRMYEVSSREQKNDLGRFWTGHVTLLPNPTPTDLMGLAQGWARELTGRVIDVTPLDEDEAGVVDNTPDLASAEF